jgi:putative ABC transport system permease protein
MKTVDIIKRAGRNLRQAKLRTALTALAISIGAFVIMTSLAFGIGINNYTDSLIGTNINDRTLSVSKETVESFMANSGMNAGLRKYSENYSKNMFIEMLDDSDITTVAKIDGVKKVIPFQLVTMKYFQLDDNEQKWSSFINMFDPFVINETLSGKILKRELSQRFRYIRRRNH